MALKRTISLICSLIFVFLTYSQEDDDFKTIMGNRETKVSGFGGPMMNFTQINNEFTHMMGGGGGVIVNDFFFGLYGMGKTNEHTYKNEPSSIMDFGHGGFWFGYTLFYNKAIHPVIHTQIGWGEISKRPKDGNISYEEKGDRVFVICPTAELEMNFSRFFKLGGGITYTFAYNTDGPYDFNDFAKPGVFLSFKFGWFK